MTHLLLPWPRRRPPSSNPAGPVVVAVAQEGCDEAVLDGGGGGEGAVFVFVVVVVVCQVSLVETVSSLVAVAASAAATMSSRSFFRERSGASETEAGGRGRAGGPLHKIKAIFVKTI